MRNILLIATFINSTFSIAQDSLITPKDTNTTIEQETYNPLAPPNTYQNTDNPNYWKNKRPHAAYWQQDVHYTIKAKIDEETDIITCLLYTSPSPRDGLLSRMPSSA